MTTRVAVYARYSSDSQSSASLDDQIRLCMERVGREGWSLEQVYRDAAISGSSTQRPGYKAMLSAAKAGGFDVVLSEALDRLSRDQEDVAALFKRLKFAGIKLVTLSEGEITELHIGMKGTMNALFLKDLADKTHRGLRGRVSLGKSAGGLCYGYSVVKHVDAKAEPIRGDRVIDDGQAQVVRRIFGLFVRGLSPIAIAKTLNEERVAGPTGDAWRDTTIRGHAGRGTGILRNELYIGRLVWNRLRFVKDPSSGKRVSRLNSAAQWICEEVPHLRIVDQELWTQAQNRLADIREARGANNPARIRFWEKRRAQHVLSGKVFCAACGGAMTSVGKDYLACSVARKQGICDNLASVRRPILQGVVVEALRKNLMHPDDVKEFVQAFTAEWNKVIAEQGAARATQQTSITTIQRKIDRLVDAITDGLNLPDIKSKLEALSAQKASLLASFAEPTKQAPTLHPNLAELYRTRVASLSEALAEADDNTEVIERLRDLVERVDVGAAISAGGAPEITLTGAIASMIRLGMPVSASAVACDHDLFRSSVKVVAGARFERAAFRL